MFTNKWGKCFRIYSTMVLLCCNYIPSICNYYHIKSNIPSCAFMTAFSSETKIKSFSRVDLLTSSGALLSLKVFLFWVKLAPSKWNPTSFSQKFGESLQRTSSANLSLSFRTFLVRIPFLWTQPYFRPAPCKSLSILSSLMNGGMPTLAITLFMQVSHLF